MDWPCGWFRGWDWFAPRWPWWRADFICSSCSGVRTVESCCLVSWWMERISAGASRLEREVLLLRAANFWAWSARMGSIFTVWSGSG